MKTALEMRTLLDDAIESEVLKEIEFIESEIWKCTLQGFSSIRFEKISQKVITILRVKGYSVIEVQEGERFEMKTVMVVVAW